MVLCHRFAPRFVFARCDTFHSTDRLCNTSRNCYHFSHFRCIFFSVKYLLAKHSLCTTSSMLLFVVFARQCVFGKYVRFMNSAWILGDSHRVSSSLRDRVKAYQNCVCFCPFPKVLVFFWKITRMWRIVFHATASDYDRSKWRPSWNVPLQMNSL